MGSTFQKGNLVYKEGVNWLELGCVLAVVLTLIWLRGRQIVWGAVPFTTGLGAVLLAIWLLERQKMVWLSDHLFFAVQICLVFDYLLEQFSSWRWKLLSISLFGVALTLFDSLVLNWQGAAPELSYIGWHTAFLFGTALVIWLADLFFKKLGLSRIIVLLVLSIAVRLLWYNVFGREYGLFSSTILVICTFVVMALSLERSSPRQTMPTAQLAAYQSLLGTLEQLATPAKPHSFQGSDLVTTLFGAARAMASGGSDNTLWSQLLNTAILLVPGAEGGVLRLRTADYFRCVAQEGYSEELLNLPFSEQSAKEWHGDILAWHRGEPRIARQPKVPLQQVAALIAVQKKRIYSNLYFPILVGNDVLADLSFDNFSNENAFSEDSIQAARQFSIQIGALINAQNERRELEARLREFAAIEAVAEALHDARSSAQIAGGILEQTMRLLDTAHCGFMLISSDTQSLLLVAEHGIFHETTLITGRKPIPRDRSPVWMALEARGTVYTSDTRKNPHVLNLPSNSRRGYCQLSVPILDSRGVQLGVLVVARELPARFSNLDQRLTELIAKVAGSTLERVYATENLERQVFESRNLLNLARLLESSDYSALPTALERVRQLAVADAALLLRLEGGLFRVQTRVGNITDAQVIARSLGLEPLLAWARQPMQRSLELSADVIGASMRQIGVRSMLASMLENEGALLGAIVIYRFNQVGWNRNEKNLIEAAGGMMSALLARLERVKTLEAAYEGSLAMIGKALEMRDLETGDHTERVARMAVRMAKALNFSELEVRAVRWGAYLHDVGKFVISDLVLRKPGKLTPEEIALIREHPQNGYNLIRDIPFLPLTSKHIVLYHHERWDGTGYPTRLAAEDIPLAARIFAVCDVYDALQSKRVYKEAYTPTRTLAELYASAQNGHLELRLVQLLERLLQEDTLRQNAPPESSDAVPNRA
ncbi:MAG: HD domain-containing phosphohydrolase [Deinococcales bacterium]